MIDYLLFKLREKMKMEDDRQKADKIIENAVVLAMASAFIPVPWLDMAAVTLVQVDMVRRLAESKGIDATDATIESLVSTLSGGLLAKLGSQALKLIPGWGTIAGGIGMAVFSGASTYAAGKTFAYHFETGGDLSNFDTEAVKKFYAEQFEKGKDFARQMKDDVEKRAKEAYRDFEKEGFDAFGKEKKPKKDFEFEEADFEEVASNQKAQNNQNTKQAQSQQAPQNEAQTPPTSGQSDLVAELEKLADLKQRGILSEEEFQKLKAKVLEKF
ncbi:DUF697 domain-containing protein [Hugenholtzia roseola]|uniref:DUF697 domain-containing protein n=1 Tax=Hugenholtzia roseola TaxID=1002 RepID=UPI0003FA1148|nr:DUF697 domain-containing protein [Hugenholtzia roseola]